jgi:hypothetical protein
MARERVDALFVAGDSLFNSRRLQLGMLAARHAVPRVLHRAIIRILAG